MANRNGGQSMLKSMSILAFGGRKERTRDEGSHTPLNDLSTLPDSDSTTLTSNTLSETGTRTGTDSRSQSYTSDARIIKGSSSKTDSGPRSSAAFSEHIEAKIQASYCYDFYNSWTRGLKRYLDILVQIYAVATMVAFAVRSRAETPLQKAVQSFEVHADAVRVLWSLMYFLSTREISDEARYAGLRSMLRLPAWWIHQAWRFEILLSMVMTYVKQDLAEFEIASIAAGNLLGAVFFVPFLWEKLGLLTAYTMTGVLRSWTFSLLNSASATSVIRICTANLRPMNDSADGSLKEYAWQPTDSDINSRDSLLLFFLIVMPVLVWIHNYSLLQFMHRLPSERVVVEEVFTRRNTKNTTHHDIHPANLDSSRFATLQSMDQYYSESELTVAAAKAAVEARQMQETYAAAKNTYLKDFEVEFTIGRGGYGEVYAIRAGQNRYALKEAVDSAKGSGIAALELEIDIMMRLSHPNILRFVGRADRGFVVELCSQGNLKDLLHRVNHLEAPDAASFTKDLLEGLSYLHRHQIVHRDIKTLNLLLQDGTLVIADFGVATCHTTPGQGKQRVKGTMVYMPPETLSDGFCGRQMDIWAAGCVVLEMMAGEFGDMKQQQDFLTFVLISKLCGSPKIPKTLDPSAQTFLKQCFQPNSSDRPSADCLLTSDFVAKAGTGSKRFSSKVSKGLKDLQDQRTSQADPFARARKAIDGKDGADDDKGRTIFQQIVDVLQNLDQPFVNPIMEDLFTDTYKAERLFIARSTGQFLNPIGYAISVISWLQNPPSMAQIAICTVIHLAAVPINYWPVHDAAWFIDNVYGRVTRLAIPFVGLMPEKHPLFASLSLFNVSTACVGSSFSLARSAGSLSVIVFVQTAFAICVYISRSLGAADQDMQSQWLSELRTRMFCSIGTAGFCFYLLYLLRQGERKRFSAKLARLKHVDPKQLRDNKVKVRA